MYIIDLNQYVIEFIAQLLILIAYYFESIIYMLLAEMLEFNQKNLLDLIK